MNCQARGRMGWLTPCLTSWLRAVCLSVCLSAFACELQITALQQRACSRQRQGFALSSAPHGCLWVLCHVTLTEIDPLHTSRSCCCCYTVFSLMLQPPPQRREKGTCFRACVTDWQWPDLQIWETFSSFASGGRERKKKKAKFCHSRQAKVPILSHETSPKICHFFFFLFFLFDSSISITVCKHKK